MELLTNGAPPPKGWGEELQCRLQNAEPEGWEEEEVGREEGRRRGKSS